MSNSDDAPSNGSNRRSFITGASLLLAGVGFNPSVEATQFVSTNSLDLGNTIPILIPLDGYVSTIHVVDGAIVKSGDLIAETESIDLNRAMIQVNTAIALVDNNSEFMLGEYMPCVKTLLEINESTNRQFEEKTRFILNSVKEMANSGMRDTFEIPARELSVLRAEGESRRSKRILAAYDQEVEQLKFRLNTLKQALQNELKVVQDMQNRMRLTAPFSGVAHLMAGVGSFVPKGGYVALLEIKK